MKTTTKEQLKIDEIGKMEKKLFSLIDTFHTIALNWKKPEREKLEKEIKSLTVQYSIICL